LAVRLTRFQEVVVERRVHAGHDDDPLVRHIRVVHEIDEVVAIGHGLLHEADKEPVEVCWLHGYLG